MSLTYGELELLIWTSVADPPLYTVVPPL